MRELVPDDSSERGWVCDVLPDEPPANCDAVAARMAERKASDRRVERIPEEPRRIELLLAGELGNFLHDGRRIRRRERLQLAASRDPEGGRDHDRGSGEEQCGRAAEHPPHLVAVELRGTRGEPVGECVQLLDVRGVVRRKGEALARAGEVFRRAPGCRGDPLPDVEVCPEHRCDEETEPESGVGREGERIEAGTALRCGRPGAHASARLPTRESASSVARSSESLSARPFLIASARPARAARS